jgi:mono/diheme cytochrome c family protein
MSATLALISLLALPPTPGKATPSAAAGGGASDTVRWLMDTPWNGPVPPAPPPSESLKRLGSSLYATRCAHCHGANGDGKGPVATRLAVKPTNFLFGIYKLRSTPSGSIPTHEDLFRTLTRGIHGTPMLPWKRLRAEERWALVYHLESFSVRFREEAPAETISVPVPPKETRALRDQGAEIYLRLRCATCHGDHGGGDGPAVSMYQRTTGGRTIRIRDFTRGRFIRGTDMSDIFLTLRAGVEGTPMGSYDGLADDDLWAVAAYVRSLIRERRVWELPPAGNQASK